MTARLRVVLGLVAAAFASTTGGAAASAASTPQDLKALADRLKGLVAKQVFVGTIVVSDTATGTSGKRDVIETSSANTTLSHNVVFTVAPGSVVAKITYEETTRIESRLEYQTHTVTGLATTRTIASGTNSDPTTVSVSVDLRPDGTYQIAFGTGGVAGTYTMTETSATTCKRVEGSTCRPSNSSNSDAGTPPSQGGIGGSVDGRIDKSKPSELVGTMSTPVDRNDGSTGRRTVTWNLSRRTP